MDIVFVLVAPAVPENIGASCRALKTMGFNKLRLVATQAQFEKQAHVLAHGSADVLQDAQCYDDLTAALVDVDWAVATSAKARHHWRELTPAQNLTSLIVEKGDTVQTVAIVFGCESSGLSNEDLALCDQVSNIALPVSYPSLNLSQAVMLYAYELRQLANKESGETVPAPASTEGQFAALKQKVLPLLDSLGFERDSKMTGWVMQNLPKANAKAIGFLHTLCDKIVAK